ncbi:hypothetical protein NDU88_008598 [Pleurodeles waltl]|uniref:Uncharacterized protein n=1 Tax=Pleurodeles waltl TaxID=8319 RepID=A0AAV7N7N0_PLEWA|nr:hypothetical protein NDU88_008598 [Pleurodeles waltl]
MAPVRISPGLDFGSDPGLQYLGSRTSPPELGLPSSPVASVGSSWEAGKPALRGSIKGDRASAAQDMPAIAHTFASYYECLLGRVDGLCRCHGFRAMERAPGRMWNAGGLAVVEKGWCGRNG